MALYNPNKAVQGIADYKAKWANAKAKGEDTAAYEQGAKAYYEELRNNGRGDIADHLEKSDAVQAGEYLKTLTPNYQATAGDLQAKSNEAYKWTTDTANQLGKDYDMVFQTIGVTPTRTDYGKDILGGYGLAAEGVYKGTLGGASGDNGGNVDSYAAAQANRNKAAMVKEGYGTVLDYYNSIAGNATNWANSKANALGGFAGLMQGNITDDRDTVEKAYDGSIKLFQTQDENKANKEIADLEATINREKMANDLLIAENDNATDIYLQQLKNAVKGTSTGGDTKSAVKPENIVDDIINRYTKDSFAVVEETEYGNKYGKDGVVTDFEAVASDLQSIIDDTTIPFEQRQAVYNNARLRGVTVGAPLKEGEVRPEGIKDNRILNLFASLPNNNERLIHLNGLVEDKTLSPGQAQWLIDKYGITI